MKGLVSIITVNYNGWKDTCEMISSFKKYENYPYEIIVVDNSSSGNDVKQIQKMHPDVKVLCAERNMGFAGGNNLGYRSSNGEYVFFLNNDTVINAPVLEPLVYCLQDRMIGGVSPLIRFYDPPYGVQYYGHQKMSPITLKHTTPPYDVTHPEKYEVSREVEVMHGAAMMIPKRVIEQVGVMPECYFLYFEEFDWSYHILDEGYRIWYEPAAVVYHKEGTKKGLLLTPYREYYLVRGRILFARRNLKGLDRMLSCFYLAGGVMLFNVLRNLLKRRWKSSWAVFTGTFSGLIADKNR